MPSRRSSSWRSQSGEEEEKARRFGANTLPASLNTITAIDGKGTQNDSYRQHDPEDSSPLHVTDSDSGTTTPSETPHCQATSLAYLAVKGPRATRSFAAPKEDEYVVEIANMAMTLSQPSTIVSRPAYLDNLFTDHSSVPRSLHSSTSSIYTNSTASSYSLQTSYHASRPLTPALEEYSVDNNSVRSKKSFNLSTKRFRFGTIFNRRTYPQANEDLEPRRPATEHRMQAPEFKPLPALPSLLFAPLEEPSPRELRRKSLPKLRTSFPPPLCVETYAKRPLPAVPSVPFPQRQESLRPAPLKISKHTEESGPQRCHYYLGRRNCPGYVIGGGPGDPCENCLATGFFGAV